MKEITTKLSLFSELSKDIQEKVAQRCINNGYFDSDIDTYLNDISGNFAFDLKSKGFKDVKIFYSLGCNQGDGACFDACVDTSILCKNEEFLEVLDKYLGKNTKRFVKHILPYVGYTIDRNSYSSNYCHSRTRYISSNMYNNKWIPRVESLVTESENALADYYQELAGKLYEELQDEYDSWFEVDRVIDHMINNEYEERYFENGNIYTG